MKKKNVITIVIILVITVSVVFSCAFRDRSIESISKDYFICSSDSPDQRYTVNFYSVNGGATTAFGILGELVDNISGDTKNIYWQYDSNSTRNEWVDNYTININGVTLDVRKDIYDWRENEEPNPDDVGAIEFWKSAFNEFWNSVKRSFGGV